MSLAALNQTIDPKHLPHANPDDTADFLAGCTECSNALRDWQTIDAIELLNWQLTNNGSTAATWFLWAVHRVMTGTLEGVERLLELCLEQTPNCLEALAFRQALALRNGQTAIATTCGLKLGSGIEANPAAQQAAQLYAQAQTMLPYPAQHEAAARLLTQALELAPWDARAWYGLALTEHGKDARRCAALATEAVIRNPLVPEAWALAITGLALSDQISAAGRAVGCGISLFPDNPTLIGSLAHLNAVGGVFDPGINRAWYTLPEGRLPATYLKSLVRRRNKGATTIRKELVLPAYGSINSHELATKAFSKAIAFNLYPKNAEHYTEELAALRQATQNFAAGRHKFTDPTPIVGTAFQWQVLDENACEPLSQLADAVRASCPMLEHTAEAPAKGVVRPRRIAVLKGLAGDDRNRAVDGLLSSLPADQYVLRSFLPIFAAPQRQSAAANDMVLPAELTAARAAIAAFAPDIVIYPSFGMNPWLYQLAFSRLAPVQIALSNQRITTGLDTIDYFISAEAFEPVDAATHYREQLIKLPGIGAVLSPLAMPQTKPTRASANLPENKLILFCAQPWPKIMPEADAILAGILKALPDAILVVPDALGENAKLIKQRLGNQAPEVVNQLNFTGRLKRDEYTVMLQLADLVLDGFPTSIGFGALEALASGTPVITLRGKTARCRVAAGLLDQVGMPELVADSLDNYRELVIDLGRGAQRRAAMRATTQQSLTKLYNDPKPATAFQDFLANLV